jgi:hypothetical protein
MVTNSLITVSAPHRLVRRTSHGLAAQTLILQNQSQAEFLEMLNACFDHLQPADTMEVETVSDTVAAPAGACAATRTYRKAEDRIRRLKGGNILNKIPVLQNEPTDLELSALDAMFDALRDFHRTQRTHGSPGLVAGYSGYKLGIGECNYIHYGLTADYLRETPGDYAAKRTGLAELHRAPHLTEKLQNEPTEPAKQALNGRDQPVNGAPNRKKAEKTAWLLMIYSGRSICFRPQRGAIES